MDSVWVLHGYNEENIPDKSSRLKGVYRTREGALAAGQEWVDMFGEEDSEEFSGSYYSKYGYNLWIAEELLR